MRLATRFALPGMVLLLAACAANVYRDPPRISLAGIQFADLSLLEQRYQLQLRIENPNPADLPITGMNYELAVNDKPFARGVSNQTITVPKFGSELIEVEGISNLSSLIPQIRALSQDGKIRYNLTGNAHVRGQTIPFHQQGEVEAF